MAKQIKQMPPETRGASAYPWDLWLNGATWEASISEDFPSVSKPRSARTLVYMAAQRKGVKVRTCFSEDKRRLFWQAETGGPANPITTKELG